MLWPGASERSLSSMELQAKAVRIGQRIQSDDGEAFEVLSILEVPGHPDWIAFEGWTTGRVTGTEGRPPAGQHLKAERLCRRDHVVQIIGA